MTTIYIAKTYSGFHVKLKSDDPQAFRLSVDTLKSFIAVPQRSFNPVTREWFVDEDATDTMHRWLSYVETHLHAEVEWIGGAAEDRTTPQKASAAYAELFLLPGAPPELVKASFKCLATLYHPDKPTGDTAKMQQLNVAYKQLESRAA